MAIKDILAFLDMVAASVGDAHAHLTFMKDGPRLLITTTYRRRGVGINRVQRAVDRLDIVNCKADILTHELSCLTDQVTGGTNGIAS